MWIGHLRTRLLIAFLVPTLAVAALAAALGYLLSRRVLEDELGQSLSRVAAASAAQLSPERLMSLSAGDDVGDGTRTFRNLQRQLDAARRAAGLARIFAFDREGRVRLDVRADAGASLPIGAELFELSRDRLELAQVFDNQLSASQVLFRGADGRLYKTGYAPVAQGEGVVAAIGVEGSADFFAPLVSLGRGYIALVAALAVVLAAASVITARALARPLQRLVQSALRIGQGDLSTPVGDESTHEISILARALESMRQAVAGRDRQLKLMLAGVAHEVRNPIGGIELFAGLLEEELAPSGEPESLAHVRRIRAEVAYLKQVVEDFLAFAREDRLTLGPVAMPALASVSAGLAQADALARGVDITLDCEPCDGVVGDESLLSAALLNLTRNAIQASPRGATVTLRGRAADGAYAMEVEDRGPGIPVEVAERVFEPFFTTKEKGTGLGLPLARKIARAHHGDLTLEVTPGRTVFRLTLPRVLSS